MFDLDIFGNPQPLNIYLCRVDGTLLGSISEIIEADSAQLSVGVNRQYQLSFDIMEQHYASWFEQILEGMYLFVEKIGLFKINNPSIELDGLRDRRSITAFSVDSELEDKNCNYQINTGLNTAEGSSLEFNVIYDEDETEQLVNEYTGVPYDWIVLYNTFPEQLTKLKTQVESGYYGTPSSGEIVVTDEEKIAELQSIFTTIPRLLNKIVKTDNPDGSQDSSLVEYVIVDKDAENQEIVTSYTLTADFVDRIDYLITFYTKYGKQLSLLDIICEETANSWSVGDIPGLADGDYSFANKKYQFEINETAYAFLTQSLAQALECVVSFDNVRRKINIIRVQDLGNDTGIIIGFDTLVNTLNISADEDRLTTRIDVSGGENLNLNTINFGTSIVDDLSYKMNARDSHGKRIYVSDELAEKYEDYVEYREELRDRFKELSVEYEQINDDLFELKNRVPLDDLKTDWGTFSMEELEAALTSYKNLLATLSSLYKNEFGSVGLNQDGSIKESFIMTTAYWWDYKAYLSIIEEIQLAIEKFPDYKDHTSWSSGDVQRYEQIIQAWETEWSLYGTIELQAKIDRYKNELDSLAESAVVRKAANTYEIKMWIDELHPESPNALTDEERAQYGGISNNYHYDEYMQLYNLMTSAQEYLDTLTPQIEAYEAALKSNVEERNQIKEDVKLKNNFTNRECVIINRLYRDSTYSNDNILSTKIDTPAEKMEHIQELFDDARDQISIVSRPQLNFSVSAENVLGVAAFNPLWSQFVLGNYIYVEYKDKTYVKLRLIGYTFNPCLPSSNSLSIEFSNFVRSRSYYRDWASLWGNSASSVSSYSSGGGGGSSAGNYGEHDDIDITISNTMLAKLLNSETFGTRVTDVILDTVDANKITARSATFGGLANGTTHIDGDCITTGVIKSKNYNGEIITVTIDDETVRVGTLDNTVGSILNIADGTFSFAGGRMKFVRNTSGIDVLTIEGKVIADDGEIGGWNIDKNSINKTVNAYVAEDEKYYDFMPQLNTPDQSEYATLVPKNTITFAVGVRENDNVNTPGEWTYPFAVYYDGSVKATKGTLGGWTLTNRYLYASGNNSNTGNVERFTGLQIPSQGVNALTIGATNFNNWTTAPFYVTHKGEMYSTKGKIGGWNIDTNYLSNTVGNDKYVYLGNGTNNNGDVFVVRTGTSSSNYEYPFYVRADGTFHAGKGTIGGWTINDNDLSSKKTVSGITYRTQLRSYDYNDNRIALAVQTSTDNFVSNWTDKLLIYYTGKIKAYDFEGLGGTIGGWTINENSLYSGTTNAFNTKITLQSGDAGYIMTENDTYGSVKINYNGVTSNSVSGTGCFIGDTISLEQSQLLPSPIYYTHISSHRIYIDDKTNHETIFDVDGSNGGEIKTSNNVNVTYSGGNKGFISKDSSSGLTVSVQIGSSRQNHGVYSNGYYNGTTFTPDAKWIISRHGNGMVYSINSAGFERPILTSADNNGQHVAALSCNSATQLGIHGEWGSAGTYAYMYVSVSSSDPRLKKNISEAKLNALELINKLPLHSFDWKQDSRHWDVGFIAPELYEIDENLAHKPDDESEGYWSVNDFYLVGVQTKAIQELSAEIIALKNEIKELKSLLNNK